MIEILQAEESAYSTKQQIQDYEKKPTASIHYQSYDSRSKKSKNPSNEQNSSSSTGSTESKRKCFRCGAPYSRKHLEECRAKEVTCNGCGIKGHLKKCCKKSGNFPKDNSNRQNQSPSTGPGRMNIASTLPQTEADFFDEKGLLKEYRPPAATAAAAAVPTDRWYVCTEKDSNNSKFSFRSSSRSSPYSRFPIPRISTHGSSKPISNRFFQHFRYVGSKRKE